MNFSFNPTAVNYDSKNAYWLGQAADLAYQDEIKIKKRVTSWGFENFTFLDKDGTQGFVAGNNDMILVGFRGTQVSELQDLVSDAKFRKVDGPVGNVHRGFKKALSHVLTDALAAIKEFRSNEQPLWITGHSLGAALATLASARLLLEELPINGVYTFGLPRVGDKVFADWFDSNLKPKTFRFVNNNDVVTRVPLRNLGYRHVGAMIYIDTDKKLHTDLKWWTLFRDRVKGRVEDLGKPGTDGVKDHSMARYLEKLEANIDTNLFT